MSKVDEKIPSRKARTAHVEYHKHELGKVRVVRTSRREMKRVGWHSLEATS